MDRDQQQGGRHWSHNKDSFDPAKNAPFRHQPNRSEPVSNTPALDQFLSGISIERNNKRDHAGGDGSNVTQMDATLRRHQGPQISEHSLPGALPPGMQIPGVNQSDALPPGSGMQIPGVNPPGALPPGLQIPRVNPTGALPPGMQIPGVNPPGALPPGLQIPRVNPTGALPPGMQIPGVNPTGALPPGMQIPGIKSPGALPPGTMMSMTPSSLRPSSKEWDSYQGSNKAPNWTVPPPSFAFSNQSQTQDTTMNWQHPASVRQNNLNNEINSEQKNAQVFNRAAANILPSSLEQRSLNEQPLQEQHNKSREQQNPLAPAQSGQFPTKGPPQSETRPTQQLPRNFHNHYQVPRLNHPDQQHNQQYQQKQGSCPQQPGPHPHQFRPRFGLQGEPQHSDHQPRQPFYQQHHRNHEQNPPGAGSHEHDGAHSFRSHPPRPLLQGSSQARPLHPSGPHPSQPHPSPRMHQPLHSRPPHFQSLRMPPPGLVPRPLPISEQNQQRLPPSPQIVPEKSQRDKDEEWMKDWLMKRKIGQSVETNENTPKANTVNDGRQLVVDLMQTLQQLSELKETLSHRIKRDESSWQYECRRVNRMKEKVEALQSRLFGSEFLNLLQNKMKKRKKKRERSKRRRERRYQTIQEAEERRAKLHLKIDTQLAKELQIHQDLKREAELQEEIDKTLYEVRKKKQEASQTLDLIKGLRKLRQLRKDAAQVKGVQPSKEEDITFDKKLKPLEELMSKQRDLYREEEKTMQVMLEEEHEEYKEQEKKKLRRRQEEKAVKEMQANMKLIFGKDELVGPDAQLFPFQQFYHQAESNMHALVDIRRQWDQFLVPDTDPEGSSIPVSWVLPSDPTSTAWTSVLDT